MQAEKACDEAAARQAEAEQQLAAIEAMGEARGTWQGVIAARQTLAGFFLDPANADVRVVPVNVWGRGQAARCDVRYRVDLSGLPWLHWISAAPTLPVWARAVGQVEAYKSEWWRWAGIRDQGPGISNWSPGGIVDLIHN